MKKRLPVIIRLKPQNVPGRNHGEVYATLMTRAGEKKLTLVVDWNVRSLYETHPPRLFFGDISKSLDKPLVKEILMRRSDRRPLQILSLKATSPALTGSFSGAPGKEGYRVLRVQLSPEAVSGPLLGELVVQVVDPVQPEIRIPFAAYRSR